MSVTVDFYSIYGIKIDFDESLNEAYEEVYNDPNCPWILVDAMTGEYMILGIELGSLRAYRDDEKIVSTFDLHNEKKRYRRNFKQFFPDHGHLLDQPWTFIMKAHYG